MSASETDREAARAKDRERWPQRKRQRDTEDHRARDREVHKRSYSTERYRAARASRLEELRAADRERKRRLRQTPGWRARSPEVAAVQWARHQARKAGVPGTCSAEEWLDVIDFYGHVCLACERAEAERPLTMDHVIPLADQLRSSNQPGNLQPLCKPCNSAKGPRAVDYRPWPYVPPAERAA